MDWLNRDLFSSPYCFGLCRDQKAFAKEMKRLRIPADRRPSFLKTAKADATTHFFEHSGNRAPCAIVCIGGKRKVSKIQVYGLLVHEAVHIWQAVRDSIGESQPSTEFEAYAIQAIAQRLMDAY